MATIGVLMVDLSTNSAAFACDIGRARASLVSSGERMNQTLARVGQSSLTLRRWVARNSKVLSYQRRNY